MLNHESTGSSHGKAGMIEIRDVWTKRGHVVQMEGIYRLMQTEFKCCSIRCFVVLREMMNHSNIRNLTGQKILQR